VSQQTTNRSFDDLARALAEGSISRRRALKLFAGTALAALIPSRALADEDCVRVCHVPFDPQTEECDPANAETRCVSRRERRRHLENHPCDCRGRCANCLTPQCLPNGGTCMANDQCCSGRCASDMCAEPCPSGTVTLSNGTCAKPCTGHDVCAAAANCFCSLHLSSQQGFCGSVPGASLNACLDDSPCPPGEFCSQQRAQARCVIAC
jgi:hypothetical protein